MVLGFINRATQKLNPLLAEHALFWEPSLLLFSKMKSMKSRLKKLEQLLYEADFGVATAVHLTNKIRELHRQQPTSTAPDYLNALRARNCRFFQ